MIRHGLLVFEDRPDATRATARRVAGLPLLDRGIRTMARAGIERLTVLVPDQAPLPVSRLARRLPLTLETVGWSQADAVRFTAGEAVLVLLGDHVHHASSLQELVAGGLDHAGLAVQTSDAPSGDHLGSSVNAGAGGATFAPAAPGAPVSTGAFLCRADLLAGEPLGQAAAGLRPFLERRSAGQASVVRHSTPPRWRPVPDRRGARRAKAMLFGQVTKPTSGFVSRHLNARVSIPISKLLIDTGISPHLVTVLLVLTTGLASAWLIAHGDSYPRLALAGFLWQMAAVLDRCDGEIARVKLCESKFGAWFDTVTDNLAYLCGYVGLLFGIQRVHPGESLYLGLWLSAAGALLLTLATLYAYARRSGSGSLQHYLRDLAKELPDSEKGWIQRAMQKYGFVAKRDFLSFVLFLAMLANSLDAVYWILVTLLHAAAGGVILSQGKMLQRARTLALRRDTPIAVEEPR